MKIISCYIENFGLLHTSSFNFSKGLNCCVSENGTGKTTLTAFIEAMLYGIGDTRKQTLDDNPRKKYMPWQGGKFGGSLTIEAGKKKYVIERSFGQKSADDTFKLIDADSGRVSTDYDENIGESLFGIDRDGFLRTAFLSEKNLQGKNDNNSIAAKLSDLVGVDGDVGGFDDALKLLEERRKFYFKRGNTGEIANVKERIKECQRKIDAIFELEKSVSENEARLKALNDEKTRLSVLEAEQKSKLSDLARQKEIRSYEETYRTMLENLKAEEERFQNTERFFALHIPTTTEIDHARDSYIEAKRLKNEALSEKGNEEYIELGAFFRNGTSFAEISDAERSAELAEEKAREILSIDSGCDKGSVEMRSIFKGDAPRREELEKVKKAKRSAISPLKAMLMLLGVALLIAGAVIRDAIGIIFISFGIGLLVASAFSLAFGRKSKELLAFIAKYGDSGDSLEDIEKKLARYEELSKECDQRRADAKDEHSALTLNVSYFLDKFPITDADSILGSVQIIKHKYTQYYALTQAGEMQASSKLEKLRRSEILANEAEDFLAKFPTSTASPFTEIRDKLNDYHYFKANVARLKNECDVFAVKYGVTGKATAFTKDDEAAINATVSELSEKNKILASERTLIERELNIARAEIDKKEEYEMAKEELEELYQKHNDSLEVIKKTSLYLKEACDNITSKYLGKTKAKFEEYSKIIAGIDGDYTLNTSFELMRTERGEAHTVDSYSRGTRDLYALGLRLALIDALYENESPFIILDDPFIAFDDIRLERAKQTLKSIGKTKQILYFTCAKSREIV